MEGVSFHLFGSSVITTTKIIILIIAIKYNTDDKSTYKLYQQVFHFFFILNCVLIWYDTNNILTINLSLNLLISYNSIDDGSININFLPNTIRTLSDLTNFSSQQ